jgi:hypothetical protein
MNDEALAPSLARWLRETEVRPPDPAEGTGQVMARVSRSRQAGRWWPPAPRYVAAGMSPGFTAARLTAATTVVGVVGTILVVVGGSALSDFRRSFVAGSSGQEDGPAIHWRSAVVDLQADALTLTVGDETYTTEGVEVVVDAYDGDLGQWALYPRWVEDGETFWLYLSFSSDGERWEVHPWIWREGVIGPGDGEYEHWTGEGAPDYDPPNAFIEFPDSGISLPVGQAFVGDWTLTDRIVEPTCDARAPDELAVTMTFENLRLEVAPRSPTLFDQLADDWFHRGSMLGEIFNGTLEPPSSRLLECPEESAAP